MGLYRGNTSPELIKSYFFSMVQSLGRCRHHFNNWVCIGRIHLPRRSNHTSFFVILITREMPTPFWQLGLYRENTSPELIKSKCFGWTILFGISLRFLDERVNPKLWSLCKKEEKTRKFFASLCNGCISIIQTNFLRE